MTNLRKCLVVFLLLAITECIDDEDVFKIPVDLLFRLDINRQPGINGRLSFTGGYLVFASLEFEGSRVQGDDVYFENLFDDGLSIMFDQDKVIDEFRFQIPQSTYDRITISFDTFDDTGLSSLVVSGNYIANSDTTYPIQFELSSSEHFESVAEDISGNPTILIDKDVSTHVNIQLDPVSWFEILPSGSLDDAELINLGGTLTILLNEEINSVLYDMVVDRIDGAIKIVFE